MPAIRDVITNNITDTSAGPQKITGRNAAARRIFGFLAEHSGLASETVLAAENGLILGSFPEAPGENLSGYMTDLSALEKADGPAVLRISAGGCLIITAEKEKDTADQIAKDFEALMEIFDENDSENGRLLRYLDAARSSISIYDREANLLFANQDFCRTMHIADRDAVIGMQIKDIFDQCGMKVHSMESNSSHMKMMDVLKDGREALDWEVRLEHQSPSESIQLVSNDMYPVLDENGQVQGMVELMRSRQQDMTRTRKFAGLAAEYSFQDIIGSSGIMREKINIAKEFANSPFNFLITGESGVGKELFAQSIHNYSSRRKGPFVALNCANFSEGLIESELFGYVGGAFTGASRNGQVGKFELAAGGTLFLDEIGELPFHFQSKLLRVLETRMITRIGSSRQIPVDVRVIAATNRDLEKMVEEGLFRQDLYYRLQVLTVEIPPLRERREDIAPLAESFLRQASEPIGGLPKKLDAQALNALMEYDWPGNVRELRNVINRATVLAKTDRISRDILESSIYSKGFTKQSISGGTPEEKLEKRRKDVDSAYSALLEEALEISGGNKKKAAELLGVSRKTFYRMLEKYNKT
ncbi:MAG: sigma-54 interaction domain-containing protein [Emergencia sp.]